ncbi:MAG: DUF4139 domain-containing protein [Candidatus Cloacimonadales bacterium]
MKKHLIIFALTIIFVSALTAQKSDQVTIYNDNFSLIRAQLDLKLQKGLQDYFYDNIPSTIDAKSVILSSDHNALQIVAQNYEFDLANAEQIMQKYIGEEVIVQTEEDYTLQGVLQFSQSSTLGILENDTEKLILINRSSIRNITLAKLPDNFYLKPTLRWQLAAPKTADYQAEISYLCDGLSWDVDYNCVWNPQQKNLLLNAWVTIKNYSGKAFADVKLKLIAGEVNRVRDYYQGRGSERGVDTVAMMAKSAPEFSEKAFHDFHLYTLDQNVSIANKQIKQLQLFPMKDVEAASKYVYRTHGSKIQSMIVFQNDKKSGLNLPLPAGRLKIYQQDEADGSLEFIGEDSINHTPTNEEVEVTTGNAFDLSGKTVVIDSKQIDRRTRQQKLSVTLNNQSKETKQIEVLHSISGDWEIFDNNMDYEKLSAYQIKFIVNVKAGAELELVWTERIKN